MKYISYIALLLLLIGCKSGYKTIPESDLKNIVRELMITDAILSATNNYNKSITDSVDYYQPIFDKYGYTQADLYYTASQLAARQSKPLANIFDEILNDLGSMSNSIHYLYEQKRKWEDIADVYYSDTILKKDTLVIGNTGKLKYVIENPTKGYYTFTFMYQGIKQYAVPLRQVVSTLTNRDKKLNPIIRTDWVSRSFTPNQIQIKITVPDSVSYDSLIFKINDPDYKDKKIMAVQDTSKSYNFRIFYNPNREDANKSFFTHMTGMGQSMLKVNIDSSMFYTNDQKDSCTLGPLSRR